MSLIKRNGEGVRCIVRLKLVFTSCKVRNTFESNKLLFRFGFLLFSPQKHKVLSLLELSRSLDPLGSEKNYFRFFEMRANFILGPEKVRA